MRAAAASTHAESSSLATYRSVLDDTPCGLDDVLIIEALGRRPFRASDYEAEAQDALLGSERRFDRRVRQERT